jgi:hypothetical protein
MRVPLIALAAAAMAAPARADTFQFTVNPALSGLGGSTSLSFDSSGTLIGNWDAVSNPAGTRTKPGLFGTFGPTENVPVPTTLGGDVGGPIDAEVSGGLRLSFDEATGVAGVTGLALDFTGTGPITIGASVSIAFGSFRTRSPDSTYLGLPVTLPIGDVEITSLRVDQILTAVGTVAAVSAGVYDVDVTVAGSMTGQASVLGNVVEIPPTPVAIPIIGTLTVTGGGATARLQVTQPLAASLVQQPGTKLPQFPLALPTILPPGLVANVLLDLVLNDVSFDLQATLSLDADGEQVAECYPDCNADGVLTVADFGCFQTRFVLADPYADCSGDSLLTVADFGCFQTRFVLGCP